MHTVADTTPAAASDIAARYIAAWNEADAGHCAAQWRAHVFERLRQQIAATGDAVLAALLEELRGYPRGEQNTPAEGGHPGVVVPLCMASADGPLAFISTTTVFGSPVDVTLQELAVESFFPSDARTAHVLRGWAEAVSHDPAG